MLQDLAQTALALQLFVAAPPCEFRKIPGIDTKADKIVAYVAAHKLQITPPTSWKFKIPGIGDKTMPKIVAHFMKKAALAASKGKPFGFSKDKYESIQQLPACATLAAAAGEWTQYTRPHALASLSTGVINGRMINEAGPFVLYMRIGVSRSTALPHC